MPKKNFKQQKKIEEIYPTDKYILVRVDDPKSHINEFGLISPAKIEMEDGGKGTVIRKGEQVKRVAVGDHVVYGLYAGETLTDDRAGKKVIYKLLRECEKAEDNDIVAILK